jgi:hypothetical protein
MTKKRISFAGKFLGFLEERTSTDLLRMSYAESLKRHWMSFLKSARSKESSHADTFQANSIFGFRLSYTRN